MKFVSRFPSHSFELIEPRFGIVISFTVVTALLSFQISAESPENIGITSLAINVACGKQLTRKPKVVGGEDAYQGEFPWLVSIKEKTGEEFQHLCGGFIVNNRYIISAAHCYEKYRKDRRAVRLNRLRVTIGEYDLAKAELPLDSIDVRIEKLTIHPRFNIYGYINDIALIKVERPMEWTPYVWPACLSSKNFEPEGRNGTVAGWGSMTDTNRGRGGDFPNLLKKATIPILSNPECRKWFNHKSVQWSPRETHFCAGYLEGGKDACRGDSGSPFLVQNGDDLVVVGIAAAGKGCGRPSLPGVYTRLNRYLGWIETEINSEN